MNPTSKLLSSALFSAALASSLPVAAADYGTPNNAAENRANVVESETSGAMDEARQKRLDTIESDNRDQRNRSSTRPAGTGTINNGAGGAAGTPPGTTPGTGPGTPPGTTPGAGPGTAPGTTPGTTPGTGNDAGAHTAPRPGAGGAGGASGATTP